MKPLVVVIESGEVAYDEGLAIQHEIVERLMAIRARYEAESSEFHSQSFYDDRRAGWVVWCTHPNIFTVGHNGHASNLLVTEQELAERGATLRKVSRGGDITYHGPGQIVGYPVLDLNHLGMGLKHYVAALEESIVEAMIDFSIDAVRIPGRTGVWIVGPNEHGETEPRKICAIGVKASHGVVMHGFALNVATDLDWFRLINPCGEAGGAVTTMEREVGRALDLDGVKAILRRRLSEGLGVDICGKPLVIND